MPAQAHAPQLLDFGPRDRLPVGDGGEALKQRAGKFRRTEFLQARQPLRRGAAGLNTPAACHLRQLDFPTGIVALQLAQSLAHIAFANFLQRVEQSQQLGHAQWMPGAKQRRLHQVPRVGGSHFSEASRALAEVT